MARQVEDGPNRKPSPDVPARLSTGAFNYRNIKDPMIDEMAEAARRTIDPGERVRLYEDIQKRVQDETHDVVLWFRNGTVAAQPSVGALDKLVHPNGSNLRFRHV